MILTAKNFRRCLTTPGRYRDTGGEVKGLLLVVVNDRNASWQLRYERAGRERWMGLGSARLISLREARIRARAVRLKILDGVDPLDSKRETKAAARAAALKTLTFEAAASAYFEHHSAKWKNARHAAQFLSSLQEYVFPVFGSLPLSAIDTGLVLKVLERAIPANKGKPGGRFWDTRPETASRVRRRIENVLDWAKVRGYRDGENPAAWSGHLSEVLPTASATAVAKNWPALPYAKTATFIDVAIAAVNDIAARALEFTVLTVARTGEVIGAQWAEIDLAARVWTVPAERMKGGKVHRVPLSDRAVELLNALPREEGNPYVFIGSRAGDPLSTQAMIKLLRKMGRNDITVHGFRSAFMDWAHEMTGYPKVVIDMALAHVVGDKVEAAYRRGELLEKRRRLMADWAKYCTTMPVSTVDVVQLIREKAMIRNHKVNISLGPGVEFNIKELEELELIRLEMERNLNQHMTWVDAIRAVDEDCDPAPLLALLNVPAKVLPFVKDLFDRKLGSGVRQRGPKIPLWRQTGSPLAKADSLVRILKTDEMTIAEVVDQVRKDNPWLAKQISRKKLIAHYTGKSSHGRRWKKKRS